MINQDKIIFLGDSYTIGEGVDINENFPKGIEKYEKNNIKAIANTISGIIIFIATMLNNFLFPPKIRIHIIVRAPVLSATVSIVCG